MEDTDNLGAVPVGSIPGPVAGYRDSDERLVITETNDVFETEYEASPGTTVRRWLRNEVGADETTVEEVCSLLADNRVELDIELELKPDAEKTHTDSGPRLYTLEPVDDPDRDESYILLDDQCKQGAQVNRIASIISHDLRNPLDIANAHLRAARETGNQEHFDSLRESHDRMERIIRDVLTLARGKSALRITDDISLDNVAAAAWETVDTEAASLSVEGDLPRVRADPDRLQRLFENLFRNSVEHAQPTEESEARKHDGDDDITDQLQIWVGSRDGGFFIADNGVGIPPEKHNRAFEVGYSSNGTGLGLTVVRRIAEAHDWAVSLTTGPHGGARFEFYLHSQEKSV